MRNLTQRSELRRPARSQPARGSRKVLIGAVDGARSPSRAYSPLCGADLSLMPAPMLLFAVEEGFEYGLVVAVWSRNRRRSESTSCSILVPTDETSAFKASTAAA